jgi:hypothetical protein
MENYALIEHFGGGHYVVRGIFSSKEKAELNKKWLEANEDTFYHYSIRPMIVDALYSLNESK